MRVLYFRYRGRIALKLRGAAGVNHVYTPLRRIGRPNVAEPHALESEVQVPASLLLIRTMGESNERQRSPCLAAHSPETLSTSY